MWTKTPRCNIIKPNIASTRTSQSGFHISDTKGSHGSRVMETLQKLLRCVWVYRGVTGTVRMMTEEEKGLNVPETERDQGWRKERF